MQAIPRPVLSKEAQAEAAASSIIEGLSVHMSGMEAPADDEPFYQADPMWQSARNLAALIESNSGEGVLTGSQIIAAHAALFEGCGPYSNNGQPTGGWRTINVYIRKRDGSVITLPPPSELAGMMAEWPDPGHDLTTWYGIGAAHYDFEHVHPFADGNGRIGRLLASALRPPGTVISDLIFHNREEYYSTLSDPVDKHARFWERLGKEADTRGNLPEATRDDGTPDLDVAAGMLGGCIVYGHSAFKCEPCYSAKREELTGYLERLEDISRLAF